MSEQEQQKVAVVVVAHPDDAEFGAAGTVATWVSEGWDVYYVICT
ncbi:MAG: PIG-L deacetylase family protein, partial [Ktedonobacteraceae bacterium]